MSFRKGLSIIELVVAVAIITVFLSAVVFSFNSFLKLAGDNIKNVKASFLAEEGIEAVRFLKVADWEANITPLDSDENYYLNFTGASWEIISTANVIDGFEREILFEDVFRDDDGSGRIVENGGTIDTETRKLTVFVSWPSGVSTTTKSISTYIAKI